MKQYKLEVITKVGGSVKHAFYDERFEDIDALRHFLPLLYKDELKDGVIEVRTSNNREIGIFSYNIPWGCYVWINRNGKTRVSPVNGSLIGQTEPLKRKR